MRHMEMRSNLLLVSKVTPLYSPQCPLDEYIISVDYCFPLELIEQVLFNNSFESKITANDYDEDRCDFLKENSTSSSGSNSEGFCPCIQKIIFTTWPRKIRIEIDALLFSFIMFEIQRSKKFRLNILYKVYSHYNKRRKRCSPEHSFLCPYCSKEMWMVHIVIFLNIAKKNILDYKWNKKIEVLVNEKCELENAMAWLSTLGGAFSALGDTYIDCAEKAGAISMQQLALALRLGDPITICRCKIYMAMSLLQRGYYKKTKKIIRELYKFSTESEGSKDFRLKNMCVAVWNRLKYVLSQKAIQYRFQKNSITEQE